MRYLFTIFFTNFILCSLSYSDNDKKNSNHWNYGVIYKVTYHYGEVIAVPGEIRNYIFLEDYFSHSLILDYNNLTPTDSEFVREYFPDWNGERYIMYVFKWGVKWGENQFALDTTLYADSIEEGAIEMEDYDLGMEDRNLKLPDEYLKNKEISSELHTSLIKSYAEGDLNSDGKTDFVVVHQDTTGRTGHKERWAYGKKEDYHLVVFQNRGSAKYIKEFSYDFRSHMMIYIGKVEIQELTIDNFPEIILYTIGVGGSGYGETVEIFSRVKEK